MPADRGAQDAHGDGPVVAEAGPIGQHDAGAHDAGVDALRDVAGDAERDAERDAEVGDSGAEVISRGLFYPRQMGIGVGGLYVLAGLDLRVALYRVPLPGGDPVFVALAPGWTHALRVAGARAYISVCSGDETNTGTLLRVALPDGATETLRPSCCVRAMTVQAGALYWTCPEGIFRAADTETAGALITPGRTGLLASDSEALYVLGETELARVRLDGTDAVRLAGPRGPSPTRAIAIGGGVLAVSAGLEPGEVSTLPVAGGEYTAVVPRALGYRLAPELLTDGASVYVATEGLRGETNRGIVRAPVGGGAAETIVRSTYPIDGLALDDAYLYWAEFGSARVMRRAR